MPHTPPPAREAAAPKLRLDFCTFQGGEMVLEGCLFLPGLEKTPPPVWAWVCLDGQALAPPAPCAPGREEGEQALSFSLGVPLDQLQGGGLLSFHGSLAGATLPPPALCTGLYMPFSHRLRGSYYARQGLLYSLEEGGIRVRRSGTLRTLGAELALLFRCLGRGRDGVKAVCARLLAHGYRAFRKGRDWLFLDRIQRAGDNGEALYQYVQAQRPPGIRPRFVVARRSADFGRLRRAGGRVLPYRGFRHKLLLLCGAVTLSSQATHTLRELYGELAFFYGDLLHDGRYAYLKHGVLLHDLSALLGRGWKNLSLLCAATRPEYRAVLNGGYGYTEKEVKLTGLARYDGLYSAPRRQVAVLPTWRKALLARTGDPFDPWHITPDFPQSAYYRFYSGLLEDPRLLAALERHGYTLCFLEHPNMAYAGTTKRFPAHPQVTFPPYDAPYRQLVAESDLLLTDYSSIAFDFAYLGKPLVYCHFDAADFFSGGQGYGPGAFQYERDGFGEVETTLSGTVSRIIDYLSEGCALKEPYRKRIDRTFAFRDQHNCARIYEEALRL